jgi:hypothetical protein
MKAWKVALIVGAVAVLSLSGSRFLNGLATQL